MTDDEKALWAKIAFRQPIDELIKHGPTIEVTVGAVDGGPNFKALAQIDTGAAGSAISRALALKLTLKAVAWGEIHQAGLPAVDAPYFRAKIGLPLGDIETEVVGLVTLDPPHDVLIGRNVLTHCRLTVDFTTGTMEFRIRKQP